MKRSNNIISRFDDKLWPKIAATLSRFDGVVRYDFFSSFIFVQFLWKLPFAKMHANWLFTGVGQVQNHSFASNQRRCSIICVDDWTWTSFADMKYVNKMVFFWLHFLLPFALAQRSNSLYLHCTKSHWKCQRCTRKYAYDFFLHWRTAKDDDFCLWAFYLLAN